MAEPIPQACPQISAVITCFHEEATIERFHAGLSKVLESTERSYEIIFVNDGSTDKTFDRLKVIQEKDPHVTVILDLFKNAGQAAAITAGLGEARGDIILSMDSDLQLDPADLPSLLAEYDKGYDVVSGCRTERKDSLMRIVPSKIANVIMRKVSGTTFRDFGCTFKLYNAKLIRAFQLGPMHPFNPVTVISKAQRCAEMPVRHYPRPQGKSGWTFAKLWNFQMEHIVSLSERPFQYMAVLTTLLAGLFCLRVALGYITNFHVLQTVTNGLLLNAIAIVFLLLFATQCVVGEFSIRAFLASRQIPHYIVRERIVRTVERTPE